MDKPEGQNFLGRWARLKAKAGEAAGQDPVLEVNTSADAPTPIIPDEASELAIELPRLEDMTPEGSIAHFLRKGIPEALKQAAMRQAWTLDPTIRNFIEVAENQYDFNNPSSIPGFGELAPGTDIAALLKQATRYLAPGEMADEPAAATKAADAPALAEPQWAASSCRPSEIAGTPLAPLSSANEQPAVPQPLPVGTAENGQIVDYVGANDPVSSDVGEAPNAALHQRRHGRALPI